MADQTKKTADYQRPEYDHQLKRWHTISKLLERIKDVREYGESENLLMRMPAEDTEVYHDRVKRSYLWPATQETLAGMLGIITAKGYSLDEIASDDFRRELMTPLKGDGPLIDLIIRFTKAVLEYGHAFILVSPGSEVNTSMAEDKAKNKRVRWSVYTPISIPNWSVDSGSEAEAGDPRFANYVVVKQYKEVQQGDFGHERVEVYLKIDREGTLVYEKREGDNEPMLKGAKIPHTTTKGSHLNVIPMVAAYANYVKPFVSKPLLNSMAQLNVAHLNATSNSDLAIRQAQFTIPVFKGVLPEDEKKLATLKVGPTLALHLPENVDFKLEETTGKSLDIGLKHLESIEKKINQISFKELLADPNISRDVSATEAEIKQQSKLSPLAAAALQVESAINNAIKIHAAYLGIKLDATERFKLNFDITRAALTSDEVRVLIELVQNKVITRAMAFDRISNGQYLDTDKTFDEVADDIADDAVDFEDHTNTDII